MFLFCSVHLNITGINLLADVPVSTVADQYIICTYVIYYYIIANYYVIHYYIFSP